MSVGEWLSQWLVVAYILYLSIVRNVWLAFLQEPSSYFHSFQYSYAVMLRYQYILKALICVGHKCPERRWGIVIDVMAYH